MGEKPSQKKRGGAERKGKGDISASFYLCVAIVHSGVLSFANKNLNSPEGNLTRRGVRIVCKRLMMGGNGRRVFNAPTEMG